MSNTQNDIYVMHRMWEYFLLFILVFHCVVSLHNIISRGQEPGAAVGNSGRMSPRDIKRDKARATQHVWEEKCVLTLLCCLCVQSSQLFDPMKACSNANAEDQWDGTDSLTILPVAHFFSLVVSTIVFIIFSLFAEFVKVPHSYWLPVIYVAFTYRELYDLNVFVW